MLGGFWPDPGWGSLGSDAVLVGFICQRSLAMWVLPWHANWHREIARIYIQFTMLLDAFSVPHSGHNLGHRVVRFSLVWAMSFFDFLAADWHRRVVSNYKCLSPSDSLLVSANICEPARPDPARPDSTRPDPTRPHPHPNEITSIRMPRTTFQEPSQEPSGNTRSFPSARDTFRFEVAKKDRLGISQEPFGKFSSASRTLQAL